VSSVRGDAEDLKPDERAGRTREFQMKADEELAAFLKTILKDGQLQRLRELVLQREGSFAVMQPEVARELGILDEQRKQCMEVVQEMHRKVEPLMKEVQSGGDPREIGPKIMKIRLEHEGKIEAILSDAQKKRWKEMLGEPFDRGD
jgi:hypothetical protein